jgi:DNA polymerase III epsilon subunit family exonuclease
VQLSFDAADRLVELVHARGGAVSASEAARSLFALAGAPTAIARSLLEDVVAGDARLAWRGEAVRLTPPAGLELPLEEATWVVFDLETTGLSPSSSRIVEIGAQRVQRLELTDSFETLVNPRVPLPPAIQALTGIEPARLRGAPPAQLAIRRFLAFAGEGAGVLVAHNARFDMGFLDRHVELLSGQRVAAPVVDTVWLARRLLQGRLRRVSLTSLAFLFGTTTQPCHRALPDARATAEILLVLIGLAQERGARTVADLVELAAPRARRLHGKRPLVVAAPSRPGVYLFRDRSAQVLYVGRARDLRARLRSYFAGGRQRPAVEAALGALDRVEWRETGSELEAALAELHLIRELRPPANAHGRGARVWLRQRGSSWSVVSEPTEYGPLAGRSLARRAARALDGFDGDDPAEALPLLHERLRELARNQRFEDAARHRGRITALERVVRALEDVRRARALHLCVLVPAHEPGFLRAHAVSDGRIASVRSIPVGPAARIEVEALLAEAIRAEPSTAAEDVDELLLVAAFLRRPPPELRVAQLELGAILAAVEHGVAFAA